MTEVVINKLLAQIIDAHGGINRWKGYEKVEATIVSGGSSPIVEFVCIAEQSLQSHAACDGCEAIEWRRQIAARILYS